MSQHRREELPLYVYFKELLHRIRRSRL